MPPVRLLEICLGSSLSGGGSLDLLGLLGLVLSGRRGGRGGGSGGGLLLLLALSGGGLGVVVLLSGGVDGDLDGDLAALDLLAVHLSAGLLLQLLGAQGDEAEATALASLAASLELLDHEAGDGAEGDLGRAGLVVLEDFHELGGFVSICPESGAMTL